MNYYEELGIGPDATEQEIRKAHRRLVKLMHPDAQPDHNLKMLAETQMRRLNSIVSTLLDSEQRRSYDEELNEASHPQQRQSILPGLRGIPWWLASAVGAVVLTLAAVWLWADHMGNGFGSRTRVYVAPPDRTTVSEMPSSQIKRDTSPDASHEIGSASYKAPVAVPQPAANDGISTAVVPDLPADTKEVNAEMAKKPSPAPAPPAMPEIKKVVSPAPKPAEPKTEVAHKVEPKVAPPPVLKQAPVLVAKALAPDAAQKSQPKVLQTSVVPQQQPPAVLPKRTFSLPVGSVIASASPFEQGPSAASSPARRSFAKLA